MYPLFHASSFIAALLSCTRHSIAGKDNTAWAGQASVDATAATQTATAQPVTEKLDQASTQCWLELQLELIITGHADLALKAVNSPFEALNSAHGAPTGPNDKARQLNAHTL